MIKFEVPGNPVALKRHRSTKKGIMYDPSKNDKADFLAKALKHRPEKPFDEPICLTLVFIFARPKSHYRTGKNKHLLKDTAPLWHTGRPDIDNLIKMIADSLNGIFWKDDACIADVSAKKAYGNVPTTKITIIPIKKGTMYI